MATWRRKCIYSVYFSVPSCLLTQWPSKRQTAKQSPSFCTNLVSQSSSEYRVSSSNVVQIAVCQGVPVGVTFQSVSWKHVRWFDFVQQRPTGCHVDGLKYKLILLVFQDQHRFLYSSDPHADVTYCISMCQPEGHWFL